MFTYQIILLVLLFIDLLIFLQHRWQNHRKYTRLFQTAEGYIMRADRTNGWHAIRANTHIDNIRKYSNGRHRRRKLDGLVILWKSKFAHLLK